MFPWRLAFFVLGTVFCEKDCDHPWRKNVSWDFETDPEFQAKLDWADAFVREEVEPLDLVWGGLEYIPLDAERRAIIDPL